MQWFDDFLGVAYRYFDLRMNVAPLFATRKEGLHLWQDTIHWWPDASIRVRFIEDGQRYWFAMGADSRRPDSNVMFRKNLAQSSHYVRFKRGVGEAAYLRFGEYSVRYISDVRDSDVCNCGHAAGDHEYDQDDTRCLDEDCACEQFAMVQVYFLRRKKTISDIKFLDIADIKDDPLSWNCINSAGIT